MVKPELVESQLLSGLPLALGRMVVINALPLCDGPSQPSRQATLRGAADIFR